MSWFTVGEIVLWLALAAVLGVVLGWLLHEMWSRRRAASAPVSAPAPAPVASRDGAPEPAAEQLIKGNRSSMIYHVPGSAAYERTTATVWFRTEAEATAAGYRRPKNR